LLMFSKLAIARAPKLSLKTSAFTSANQPRCLCYQLHDLTIWSYTVRPPYDSCDIIIEIWIPKLISKMVFKDSWSFVRKLNGFKH